MKRAMLLRPRESRNRWVFERYCGESPFGYAENMVQKFGRAPCGATAVVVFLATACSSGGDGETSGRANQPVCPTSGVMPIELTQVAPATGASVPNGMIAHTYQTVGLDARFASLRLATLGNHTAGAIPALSPTVTPVPRTDGSGNDYLYAFTITWPTAPGHVALADPSIYQSSADGCEYQLPSPLFEYDVTP